MNEIVKGIKLICDGFNKSVVTRIIKFIKIILNPVFYLSGIFIAFCINSFFTSDSNNLPSWISFIVEERFYTVLIIILWGIFAFGKLLLEEKNTEIHLKDKEIESLKESIKINSGVIEAKYGEFAKKINEENILFVLKKTIAKIPLIEAIHIHKYKLQRVNENIEIKINFYLGCEQERVCINTMNQQYYTIDEEVFMKISAIRENSININFNIEEEVAVLQNLIENKVKEENMKLKLIEILLILLIEFNKGNENYILEENGECKDMTSEESKLSLMVPIIINNGYAYRYRGINEEKKGRYYFSSQITFNEDYIMTIVMNGGHLDLASAKSYLLASIRKVKNTYKNFVREGS